MRIWDGAVETNWKGSPVWIHGDISPGNLLMRGGRLSAAIDFGMCGVGDPACDLGIAWTLFSGDTRRAFRTMLALDGDTWARGRAWALWKALILAAGIVDSTALEAARCRRTIGRVLEEHRIDA